MKFTLGVLTGLAFLTACAAGSLRVPPPQSAALHELAGGTPETPCAFHDYVPPVCNVKGAFRRFYTSPGASYIFAEWSPSSNTTTLPTPVPTSHPPAVPATGLLYVQGWPTGNLGGASTQAGFRYDPAKNWFTPFFKPAGGRVWNSSVHFAVAQLSVTLSAGSTCAQANATCAVAAYGGTCAGATTACSAAHSAATPGWNVSSCCVLASLIAVAEPAPGRDWKNGAVFGPVDQVVCAAATVSSAGCTAPGLIQAGQRHPNDASRIVVRDVVPGITGAEIDTIDLHP